MMQSYLLAARTVIRRLGAFGRYFDLQIIQGLPQVKTPPAAPALLFRISLSFKQLAHGLRAGF